MGAGINKTFHYTLLFLAKVWYDLSIQEDTNIKQMEVATCFHFLRKNQMQAKN